MAKKNIILSSIILLVVTFIIFVPSLKNDFINLDDDVMVTENTVIQEISIKNIGKIFSSAHYGLYHPLVQLTYMVDFKLYKLNPAGYRFTNIFLHSIISILCLFLVLYITNNIQIAFITGVLFAIHPIHSESIIWISERKDMVYAPFFLGSIIFYFRYLRNLNYRDYSLSIFLFILSALSKPMAVTLPAVLLLLDYHVKRKDYKKIILDKLPFIFISLIITIITIAVQYKLNITGVSKIGFSLPKYLLFANFNFILYIYKFLLPINLSVLYPYSIDYVITNLFAISVLTIPVTIILLFLLLKIRDKILFLFLVFFIITILPGLHFIPFGQSIPANRHMYIPSLGLVYMIAFLINELIKRYKKEGLIVFATLVVLLSFLTFELNKKWKNSFTLWNDVIKKYPETALAYKNRADAFKAIKFFEYALADYKTAIKLKPDYAKAYNNMGNLLKTNGQYKDAIESFDKAISVSPDYLTAYYNRGIAYSGLKKYDKSLEDYNKVLEIDPNYLGAINNIGTIYARRKKYDKAIEMFTNALEINPDFPEALKNRAHAYYFTNKKDLADQDKEKFNRLTK